MLRRDRQLRTQIYQFKDAGLFVLALWLAHSLRSHLPLVDILDRPMVQPFSEFAWLYLIIAPGAPLVLELQGFYRRPLFCSRWLTAWILLKSCIWVTFGVIGVLFLFQMNLARLVVIFFGVISYLLVFLSEELLRRAYRSKFADWQFRKRVLLIGAREDTARTRAELLAKVEEGLEIVGELDLNEAPIEQLVRLLHEKSPNGVILNAKHTFFGQIEKAIQACEVEGVEAWLVADFFQTQISRTTFDEFYGRPVLVFRSVPEAPWQGIFKQLIDLILAFLLLLISGPFMIVFALLIRLTSPGPVLFRQQRCGLNGRPFTMLKFRSMVSDAEQRKQELAALNEMGGPVFKVTNDPRVTPVGRFLRRWSIDEWPQFINVLRGEMSLVGPRPLPVDEVERFDDPSHRRRLSVRPGLTCLWQVSGRNEVRDFKDWVRLDLEYIDHWSLWLDLKILWRTIPAVLNGTGAK
jgi:exopolysaccharide biosynthesis polyprenyl glycosylphosphotransferase